MAQFNDAATALLLQSPFFGTLLMKLKHVPDRTLNPPTLAVSQNAIYYHPDFIEQLTNPEGVFVLAHEVTHPAMMHLTRMKHYMDSGIGPDGKPYDHYLMNIACDYIVNDSLQRSGVGDVPRESVIKIFLDPKRFPCEMTPEEVYIELKKNPPPPPPAGGGGRPGNGEPELLDGHMAGDGQGQGDKDGPASGHPPITAADVIQAAGIAKMTQGKLPVGIDRLIGELEKPKAHPWKRVRHFVQSMTRGFDAMSWRRLQRRMIVRGVGMPSPAGYACGVLGIIADTSGSIDDVMLRWFGGHMAAIQDACKPEAIRIYWTDAKVHRVDVAKRPSDLRQILSKKVPGGGGTDMRKGVAAAEADGCDAIIVLTDGYTPFCGSKKPLTWTITTPSIKPPANCGQHVHIAMGV